MQVVVAVGGCQMKSYKQHICVVFWNDNPPLLASCFCEELKGNSRNSLGFGNLGAIPVHFPSGDGLN